MLLVCNTIVPLIVVIIILLNTSSKLYNACVLVMDFSTFQVTTSNGTKLKANFPEATTIEAGAKSPRKPPRPLRKIIHGHDPNILQQAIK